MYTKSGMGLISLVFTALFISILYGQQPPLGDEVFIYSAKFVCGLSVDDSSNFSVVRGKYRTVVNIHNFSDTTITVWKKAILALPQFQNPMPPSEKMPVTIGPDGAFEVDCREIAQWLNLPPNQFATGFVVIESRFKLDVVAVYTVEGLPNFPPTAPSIDVEYVPESHPERVGETGQPVWIIIVITIVIVILLIILILFLFVYLRRKK